MFPAPAAPSQRDKPVQPDTTFHNKSIRIFMNAKDKHEEVGLQERLQEGPQGLQEDQNQSGVK